MIKTILSSLLDSFLCIAFVLSVVATGWIVTSYLVGHYSASWLNFVFALPFIMVACISFVALDNKG
jgi:hypothetical protein